MPKLISVIIPSLNSAKTIKACLDSVLSQTFPVHEVIVVDDGSTDLTKSIVSSYGSQIRLLSGPSLGAGPARNVGISASSGTYLAFLDSDDVWHPEKIERQYPFLEAGAIIGSYARYVVGDSRRYIGTSVRTPDDVTATQYLLGGKGMPALLSSWVICKSDIIRHGLFDPDYFYAQDYEFANRLLRCGMVFKVVREELLEYLIHAGSESASAHLEQFLTAEYVRESNKDTSIEPLADWLSSKMKDHRLMRVGRSGFYFRRALVEMGNSSLNSLLGAAVFFMISFCLNPRRFVHKLATQGPQLQSRRL